MFDIRYAAERGKADFGWLQSQHTFSFGSYYDPAQMGFSALRVINDDRVAPGAGFDTHGHKDMEILSLVLTGQIAHKDSAGNTEVLPAGEFQLMSAGKGIYHSEFNASKHDELTFLQIWLQPNQFGGKPGYQQKDFGQKPGLTLILSPDGREGSLTVLQDAQLYQLILATAAQQQLDIAPGRKVYIHLISGELDVAGHTLQRGDGIKVSEQTALQLTATSAANTVFTRTDIDRLQPTSVTDLLSRVPGVQVAPTGGRGSLPGIFIRGTKAAQSLVLVDGVRIANATSGDSGLQFLDIDQIERIEVLRGSRSAVYGSDAIGGVIQIFTRRSSGPGLQPRLRMAAGSNQTFQHSLGLSGGNDTTRFNLGASLDETAGIDSTGPSFASDGDHDAYRNKALNLSLSHTFGERFETVAASARRHHARTLHQVDLRRTLDAAQMFDKS